MGKRAVNKKTRAKIPKPIMIILIIMAAFALLSIISGAFKSSEINNSEKEEVGAKQYYLSEDVSLNVKNDGAAYLENVNGYPFAYLTDKSDGDYILVDFPDVSLRDFMNSNHSSFRVCFDIIGTNSNNIPIMDIFPVYSLGAPEVQEVLKLTPSSDKEFNCSAFVPGFDMGIFSTSDVHTLQLEFTRTSSSVCSLSVILDDVVKTKTIGSKLLNHSLKAFKIQLSNTDKTSAVRVANVSFDYVPSQLPYPAESIVIPENSKAHILTKNFCAVTSTNNSNCVGINYTNGLVKAESGMVFDNIYFSARLYNNDSDPLISLYDYDYLTIEFKVSVAENIPFKFSFHLLGRPYPFGSAYTYSQSVGKIYCAGSLIHGVNRDESRFSPCSETVNVKYVIKANEATEMADLQLYFNDTLYYSATEALSSDKHSVEEIRMSGIKGYGSLYLTDLVVTGYNENN